MRLLLDPIPADVLDALHDAQPHVAQRLEECLDWIESDPVDPRARRRQFTNGIRAITSVIGGEEWLLLWEEDPDGTAVVRFIGQSASL
ncbi:MAG: hypothetical protein ACYC2Z_02495 [Candidatus Nanopelagicales bacterium]